MTNGDGGALAGGRRVLVTLADQALSSVSNFAMGVAVARAAGAAGLGGFAFAYSAWLVLAAIHRSLVTDPMSIEGDAREASVVTGVARGFAAELLLGLVAAFCFGAAGGALLLVHERAFGVGMVALAPWLPSLVVQDYWRWVGFMGRRPVLSLANDTVFNLVEGASFAAVFVFGVRSLPVLIAAWGLGALSGAVYGLWQVGIRPSLAGGMSLLRARWPLGKWIAGSSLTSWGAGQASVFITAGLLGPVALGGLRAAMTLISGPTGVLIQAGGSIGLPEASRAYDEKGWKGLNRVARIVTAAGFISLSAITVVVIFWGRMLLSDVYGPSFARYHLLAVLFGVSAALGGLCLGPILVLKAVRQTRSLLQIELVALIVTTASAAALCVTYGLIGAVESDIAKQAAYAALYRWREHQARHPVLHGGRSVRLSAGAGQAIAER